MALQDFLKLIFNLQNRKINEKKLYRLIVDTAFLVIWRTSNARSYFDKGAMRSSLPTEILFNKAFVLCGYALFYAPRTSVQRARS